MSGYAGLRASTVTSTNVNASTVTSTSVKTDEIVTTILTGTQNIMTNKTAGQINIGASGVINNLQGITTATLSESTKIRVPVNVGNIEICYGNTSTTASLGYSFNTKSSTASGTNQPVQLFSLINTSASPAVQYFEINITGHVTSLGATGQRLAIWVWGAGAGLNPAGNAVFLLGFNIGSGSILNVDFSPNTAIIRFTPPGSNGYSLCATLTSYPTMGPSGNITDWAVTAL